MSVGTVRPAMVPVTRRMRAYFAPVDRATEQPVIFDPGKSGVFNLATPPSPWLDLGWIDNFQRVSGTSTDAVHAGTRGAAATQFRGALDARIQFDFREWGKLQMALSCGSEHMNVLAPDPSGSARPSGGTAIAPVAILPGSTTTEIIVGAGAVDAFSIGDLVAVDADYQQQTGYVGTGISAAYVRDSAAVNHDPDYVRRVTFNVGRVAEKTATSLLLAQPLLGGTPNSGAGVQRVAAFVDREGGSFFQEWSALFVAEEDSGGRVCFYYPRLSPQQNGQFSSEERIEIVKPVSAMALRASFLALANTDTNDGATVVCYRSYFPVGMAPAY
jgi:hypothetical protein